VHAAVTWDSHGLHIDAANSSLHQILNDVASETGAKVEGLGADERVFGEYGPGQARDVLSQLLHGSGYNVLLIGDQGEGTPRQIVLSARHASTGPRVANPPNADNPDEDTPDAEPEEPQPIPRPGFIPPGIPRTPQEMRERQQQMQEMRRMQQMPPQKQQQPQ
jgi:hypothetical protein